MIRNIEQILHVIFCFTVLATIALTITGHITFVWLW